MNLGKEVATRFAVLGMIGMVIAVGTLMFAILPGSPYGFMKPAAPLIVVHLVSGILMLFAGMFGSIASQISEGAAARYTLIKWVVILLTAVFLFLLYTSWDTYTLVSKESVQPTWEVTALAVLIVTLACAVYLLAMRYVLRVWRLHLPYR